MTSPLKASWPRLGRKIATTLRNMIFVFSCHHTSIFAHFIPNHFPRRKIWEKPPSSSSKKKKKNLQLNHASVSKLKLPFAVFRGRRVKLIRFFILQKFSRIIKVEPLLLSSTTSTQVFRASENTLTYAAHTHAPSPAVSFFLDDGGGENARGK